MKVKAPMKEKKKTITLHSQKNIHIYIKREENKGHSHDRKKKLNNERHFLTHERSRAQ